ncbi:GAF and ANTAR domain-containing protein [Geodermatophilus sp. SYSU D01045]
MDSSQEPRLDDAAGAPRRRERLPAPELSTEDLLHTVAALARTVVPGDTETSVSLLVDDVPTTVAATGRLAVDVDEAQYERDHGPCLHAARTGELVEVADTRTDSRWPDYVPRAVAHGALSSLSVPLVIDADRGVAGALNIYARAAHAFDEDARAAATRLGPHAAAAAGDLHAMRSARAMADDLRIALEARAVIDQATGVLVQRLGLTADQAIRALARASAGAARRDRDVAHDLVRTGELPAGPPAGEG